MESPSLIRVRSPLSSNTNSPAPTAIPAPVSTTADRAPTLRQIRRKGSLSYHKKDSSEEIPSSNGSIYNAHTYSQSTSADSNGKPENTAQKDGTKTSSSVKAEIDHQPNWESWEYQLIPSDDAVGITPFMYGQGTRLDTIIEKNSNSTMKTLSHSRSTGAISTTTSSLSVKASFEKPRLQRRRSISLDDLSSLQVSSIRRTYDAAIASAAVNRPNRSQVNIHGIYAQPKKPLLKPPARPETPPGMPSWTANQQRRIPNRTSSDTRTRIMKWWYPRSTMPSRIPTLTDNGVQMPRGLSPIPRFRPPHSAYGSLDAHPFSRLPIKPNLPAAAAAASARSSRLKPSGITVTRTWRVDHTPPLPSTEKPSSKPSTSDLSRAVRVTPPVVGFPEGSASTLLHSHNFDPLTSRTRSSSTCSSAYVSTGNRSSHRRHRSLPTVTSRKNIKKPPTQTKGTTTTGVTSRLTAQQNGYDPIPSRPITASTIPGDDNSAANIPTSPASDTYLVPVTNIEAEKRKRANHDRCVLRHVSTSLSGFGAWVDRTGEKVEKWADHVVKDVCFVCCGFLAEEEADERSLGMRARRRALSEGILGERGRGEMMLGPRQVGFAELVRP